MKISAIMVSAVVIAAIGLQGQAAPQRRGYAQKGAATKKAVGSALQGMLGAYPMTRDASGTGWQPDSTPLLGRRLTRGAWSLMLQGFADFIYDRQDSPRGENKTFITNMFMLTGRRPLGQGSLGLRGMFSLEPVTVGEGGYPLLFQTGETSDGKTPLIDRQYPLDLFMELAAVYRLPLAANSSLFFYGALPGEPALGPPAYLQRFSGYRIPDAPLTRHWLDSTQITFGVATLGYVLRGFKVEGSLFRGREPDEHRGNIEEPKLDSYSLRVSLNPGADWALQASRGFLKSPAQVRPDEDAYRTTASVIYNRPLQGGDNWQTTLAWGRNDNGGRQLDGVLLESSLLVAGRLTLFGRFEDVEKEGLLLNLTPPVDAAFRVGKFEMGFSYDLSRRGGVRWGIGGSFAVHAIPDTLKFYYGETPVSALLFASVRI